MIQQGISTCNNADLVRRKFGDGQSTVVQNLYLWNRRETSLAGEVVLFYRAILLEESTVHPMLQVLRASV
jgi:hypothetical protein